MIGLKKTLLRWVLQRHFLFALSFFLFFSIWDDEAGGKVVNSGWIELLAFAGTMSGLDRVN